MGVFNGITIRKDVRCAGLPAAAVATHFPPDSLLAARATFSLTGEEQLAFAVPRDDDRALQILRHRVAVVMVDGAVADEWRIADVRDGGTGDSPILTVKCYAISADLSRAVYRSVDAEGVPIFDYALAAATASDMLAGPFRDACDAAGIPWAVAGTVDAAVDAHEFDQAGEYESARQIIAGTIAPERAPAEFRFRRNGDTDYRADLLEQVGSTAPTLHIQPAKNLVSLRRERLYADYATRVIPQGKQDQTHRGIGYAYWLITDRDTTDDWIEVADPRGGVFPGPIGFDNQHNGRYVAEIGVAFMSAQIISTTGRNNLTPHRIYVADASLFTVGRYVEFRESSGVTAPRLSTLEAGTPAGTEYNGTHVERILPKSLLSGAINYAVNPIFAAWANPSNPPDDYTLLQSSGTVTGSQETSVVKFGAYSYKVTTGAPGVGAIRSPTQRVYDDSPYAYQVWAWVRYTNVSYPPTVSIVRADTHVVHGGTLTLDPNIHPVDTWILVAFEIDDVAAAAGGFKVEVSFSAGAVAAYYLGAVGIQPLAWERADVYTPMANDLYHAGNQYLLDAQTAAQYDGTIVDWEDMDGNTFPDDALVLGQTAVIYDPALNFGTPENVNHTTTQRVLEFTRDYLQKTPTTLRFGRPRLPFNQWLNQRTQVTTTITPQQTKAIALDIAQTLQDAEYTGENDLSIEIVDGSGTPQSVFANISESDIATTTAKTLRRKFGTAA